jgi:hypothetical protein
MSFLKESLHSLLLGRLLSKLLSWIISVELSQISTPQPNSGFVLCNFSVVIFSPSPFFVSFKLAALRRSSLLPNPWLRWL